MILHRLLVAAGAAVIAFGLAAVAVIEALAPTADIGAGIVGVGVGALAALVTFVVVALVADELEGAPRWALDAVGVAGLALVAIGAVVYVDVISIQTTTAVALAFGIAAVSFAGAWLGRRPTA